MHQAEEPPLVRCPQLHIQYIPIYPPYLKHFLRPKPEDALCRDDRIHLFIEGGTQAKGVRELGAEECAQEERGNRE